MDIELNQALHKTAATALARNKERDAFRSFADSYLRSQMLVEFPTDPDGNCAEHALSALLLVHYANFLLLIPFHL